MELTVKRNVSYMEYINKERDCRTSRGPVRNGCNGKKCVLFCTFSDKRTSQKMPFVLKVKVLDDHDSDWIPVFTGMTK
jgi:hypothetical protein